MTAPKPDVVRFARKYGYFVLVDTEGNLADKNPYGHAAQFAFGRRSTAVLHATRRGLRVVAPSGEVIS